MIIEINLKTTGYKFNPRLQGKMIMIKKKLNSMVHHYLVMFISKFRSILK